MAGTAARIADVWTLDLSADLPEDSLDAAERARADRFVVPAARRRFVAAKVLVRRILADRLGVVPAAVRFGVHAKGKPFVMGAEALRFNLSHSGDLCLLAVTEGVEVGIDVEGIRPLARMDQLAARVFTGEELAAYHALPEDKRRDFLFTLWARKEAVSKAVGLGFAIGFSSLCVLDEGLPVDLAGGPVHLTPLPQPAGHAAALASVGGPLEWVGRTCP